MTSNRRSKAVKVYIHTLGCPKNEWDSDVLLAGLAERGFAASSAKDAEVIVVNTCSFIEQARRESIDEILEMAAWKETGPCRRLVVTGCLAERYRSSLPALLPEVDACVPLTGGEPLADALIRLLDMDAGRGTGRKFGRTPAAVRGGTAYLKISEGCDRACTFCAIPGIRGRHVSRPLEAILREAEQLAGMGARELVLVAQDSTSWGSDLFGKPSLPRLLKELVDAPGEFRLRLLYLQPEGVDDMLLETMTHPRICSYLDIPLQHVAGDILRRMGRPGSAAQLRQLLRRVREALPDVALRTTLLLGFPGETRESFKELLDFVDEARFDWLGVFGYSREEGTRALDYGRGPAARTVEARRARVELLQQEIMLERAEEQVGRRVEVLVERPSDTLAGCMEGRSPRHAPDIDGIIYVHGTWETGRLYPVEVTGTEGIDEVGRVAG